MLKISLLVFSIWRDGNLTPNWKILENIMLRGYLVSKAHTNKIPTVVRINLFNGNNIHIVRCSRHTGNKYGRQKSNRPHHCQTAKSVGKSQCQRLASQQHCAIQASAAAVVLSGCYRECCKLFIKLAYVPLKIALSPIGIWTPIQYMIPWSHVSPHPKWHLDQLRSGCAIHT